MLDLAQLTWGMQQPERNVQRIIRITTTGNLDISAMSLEHTGFQSSPMFLWTMQQVHGEHSKSAARFKVCTEPVTLVFFVLEDYWNAAQSQGCCKNMNSKPSTYQKVTLNIIHPKISCLTFKHFQQAWPYCPHHPRTEFVTSIGKFIYPSPKNSRC